MGMMTVRDIPEEVHNALRARAKMHKRSTEAEARWILEEAVKPKTRVQMGDALTSLGRSLGLTNEDFMVFDQVRETTLTEPMRFE